MSYALHPLIAEFYDQHANETADLALLLKLIRGLGPLRILEPFCGTGRILLPLVQVGHALTGIELSAVMLSRLEQRLSTLPGPPAHPPRLLQADAVHSDWPAGFDLVVLAGNCFYELPTPEAQRTCLEKASRALKPDGFVFVDNDHMEGDLDPDWQQPGESASFPSGVLADGTRLASTIETIWFDAPRRLVRFRRKTLLEFGSGNLWLYEYLQQKHPPSTGEVRAWLEASGFQILSHFGDWAGALYQPRSKQAIFWARKIAGGAK